ncbi:NAD(P)H-binding protein [Mariprofundus ferrooxydans]|uniref:NAD(P)H-binding protein n=1 Tax=Mariprofundus ferrooxydans TaxID=314344 RepID=UPI000AA1054D
MKKICIVGASGKLGRYMVQHALDRGYEIVGVCREQSVPKLADFEGRITIIPGATNDREVIKRAVSGCDGVLTVLAPWGVQQYSSGTAQAVMDFAEPGARLIFSCGWHISRDGKDVYSWKLKALVRASSKTSIYHPVEASAKRGCMPVKRSPTPSSSLSMPLSHVVQASMMADGRKKGSKNLSRAIEPVNLSV